VGDELGNTVNVREVGWKVHLSMDQLAAYLQSRIPGLCRRICSELH